MKIDERTRWSYCIGATGRDAAYALVSMYLLVYVQYTVKLTTSQFAVISGCMVACMVWDAINDQLMVSGIAFFFYNICQNLLLLFGVNFFYVEYGYSKGGSLVLWYTVMYGLGTLVSQALFSTLTKFAPKKTSPDLNDPVDGKLRWFLWIWLFSAQERHYSECYRFSDFLLPGSG
ncbi:MAG: hypothetical protein VZR23_00015 [Lachnospiraceae bacterium]|jgi:Na+/melibiose symporter-like transporter|nr:hypothetical protein [Lachnospiraceae bacterium]